MKPALVFGFLFFFVTCSLSQTASLQSLVDAEKAFAAMSSQKGMKNAFVVNLADDAIIFRPGPINGKEYWLKREPTKATLKWHPVFADIAASGELGYTMGPSLFTPPPELDRPPTHGYFFSIWKQTSDGSWKVALDAGISTPLPKKPDTALTLPAQSVSPPKLESNDLQPVLLQLERSFSTLAEKKSMSIAYSRYLASDARVMREGNLPFIGLHAVVEHLRKNDGAASWVPISSRVANSLDLGYTYGQYEFRTVASKEFGHYIHVWKRQPNGAWKVVFETLQPMSGR